MKADKLILGNIYSMDGCIEPLRAMTIKDGLIQYVGNEKIARKLCDENTEVLDFGDNYIYPGFIDSHLHGLTAASRITYFADLTSGEYMTDYVKIMKDFMEKNLENHFFYGAGWREIDCKPTAAMLDAICPDKVMVLNSVDGHSVWLNSKAMEKFGVDTNMAEKWGPNIVRVNEDGTPTGYITEGPVNDITAKITLMDKEESKYALLKWQEFALSLGITAYYEAGAIEYTLQLYSELIQEGKWKIRVYCGYYIDENEPDYVAKVREAKEMADKYNCEYLQIIGVKIFMDGVVEGHTAWTIEEYDDMPGYTGVKRCSDFDRVVELYREAEKLGFNQLPQEFSRFYKRRDELGTF
ncbi:MAG: amidohydrolase family protein, partial [Bacillota bacterium]|nr:amidohydrolase family protein [Bacillota bacterium]